MVFRRTVIGVGAAAVLVVSGAGVLGSSLPAAAQAARTSGWRVAHHISTKNTSLEGIVATSRTTAWATGQTAAQTPVVYRYARGRWHAITRPGPAGSFASGIVATSNSNVWVEMSNEPAVDHWNGHRWIRKTFTGTGQVLTSGLVATGSHSTWVFLEDYPSGKAVAWHYNGHSWKSHAMPLAPDSGSELSQVSASSSTNIWAWAYDTARSAYVTLHYNGHSWHVIKLPAHLTPAGDTVAAQQMLAQSRTSVWATVTASGATSVGPVMLLHWTGHAWHKITRQLPAGALEGAIAADGHGGLWLAGETNTKRYFEHYHAGTWTRWSQPVVSGNSSSVSAMALIPGTRSVWAVGSVAVGFGTTAGSIVFKYGS